MTSAPSAWHRRGIALTVRNDYRLVHHFSQRMRFETDRRIVEFFTALTYGIVAILTVFQKLMSLASLA